MMTWLPLAMALAALSSPIAAQQTPESSAATSVSLAQPTTAAPSATIIPTFGDYTYIGCWNDTSGSGGVGARILESDISNTFQNQTVTTCLTVCNVGSPGNGTSLALPYAGLEYGRECYCGRSLSASAVKLNDSACDLACVGNSSQICGGRFALSLYNYTEDGQQSRAGWSPVTTSSRAFGWAAFSVVIFAFAACL